MSFAEHVKAADQLIWGPVMLLLLLGTSLFLTLRTGFLPWRNLGYALRCTLSREARRTSGVSGDVSPFSALMTTLAATVGTGNIVGVATALVSGGPGALVWMELSAAFGLSSKFSECLLAVKYRQRNDRGEMSGGPMYTIRSAMRPRWLARRLAALFALFTVAASFGIGNMTQAHSIAASLDDVFAIPHRLTGAVLALLTLGIILGGIRQIARVSSVLVPLMALFYLAAGLLVLFKNLPALPGTAVTMLRMAFCPPAAAGGIGGAVTASVLNAARYGLSRGCFSNEAGMGSAAITAASAATDHPVRQGYINMTGTFFDTMVICTVTGLCICSSGVLGAVDPVTGKAVDGAALTVFAFRRALGRQGGTLVSLSIVLFAFSTIIGWEYNGEKAFEYLFGLRPLPLYRVLFALSAYMGAVQSLELVWNISDIFNALMAAPNLLCLLLLSGTVAREARAFQPQVALQRAAWRRHS